MNNSLKRIVKLSTSMGGILFSFTFEQPIRSVILFLSVMFTSHFIIEIRNGYKKIEKEIKSSKNRKSDINKVQ